ncbi:MAG: ion transporter [Sandaracinaceae bacterium]
MSESASLRARVRHLFEDPVSPAGRVVGWTVMLLIIASCVAVAVETIPTLPGWAKVWLRQFEYVAVAVFAVEYVLRVGSAERPLRKALEPLVLVDLAAILPFFVGLLAGGVVDLRILRLLRTVRLLRMLKLHRYTSALSMLGAIVKGERHKLGSFLLVALIGIVLMGSVMFYIEPETFESIPHAIWWSVVTLTTVGYGETVPQSAPGRFVASLVILLGIGIIAIPTGIMSSAMVEYYQSARSKLTCATCRVGAHAADAAYCRVCGSALSRSS